MAGPDVDRLALICEDESMFGEEYTLVTCAGYVLGKIKEGFIDLKAFFFRLIFTVR